MSLQEQYPNTLLESEFLPKSQEEQMDVIPMIIKHHRRASKCIVSDDEEEGGEQQQITLTDSLHKMRRVTQESAKSIIMQNSQSRIIKKRKVMIEESEDEDECEEKVKQCDALTMFSTSCSNLSQSSASRAHSTFSAASQEEEQEQFSISGQYKFTDLYTTLPLELTLEQIISDAKSGTPSLLEEKARQNKVLKQRQLKNSKIISESTESSAISCVSQLNISTQQTPTIIEQQPSVVFAADTIATTVDPKLVKERLVTRINSNTFSLKKTHTKKWSDEETLRFFKGLQAFGTDFSLIQQLFPERTRAQIKNKFRKEEKENNKIVEESIKLNQKRRYNKIQAKLTVEKEKIEAITPETLVEERIDLLRQVRSKRLNSFESVDSADIEVAEKINEIFKRENASQISSTSIMI